MVVSLVNLQDLECKDTVVDEDIAPGLDDLGDVLVLGGLLACRIEVYRRRNQPINLKPSRSGRKREKGMGIG